MKTMIILLFSLLMLMGNAQEIHIYGGENNGVYLGCLTCNSYDPNSVWNAYGIYGSKYSDKCIWNNYCLYGGVYSNYSPWNKYGTKPPKLYDANWDFYGYLTTNTYTPNRADTDQALLMYRFYEAIPDDLNYWYDKIMR